MPHSSSSSSSPVSTISNLRIRALILWSSKNYAIAAFVFLLLFSLTLFSHLDSRSHSHSRYPSHPRSTLVPLTLLRNANRTRALCLDGSAPGYHFQSGFGSGSRNWLLHIEGGGWCNSIASCTQRKFTHLGSSNYMEKMIPFSGILSSDPSQNPDFFNWNKVKIRYCDGASFAGHPESESGSELLFRGQVIWEAIMDEILSIGLSKAKQTTPFIFSSVEDISLEVPPIVPTLVVASIACPVLTCDQRTWAPLEVALYDPLARSLVPTSLPSISRTLEPPIAIRKVGSR